ncbi:hypothetical protein M3Y98_00151400 [Aphelenchoides besseyi]|nr:hypothetical protein M3Y98_00151400 [Aphelenchoides besseyi]KAI6199802.1 hypothetical protein M3Y96_00665700 [Aphelenchoides besseyi]
MNTFTTFDREMFAHNITITSGLTNEQSKCAIRNESTGISVYKSTIYIALCFLLLLPNTTHAAPLQSNGLDRSLVYQSLLRSTNNQQPDSMVVVRARRSSEDSVQKTTGSVEPKNKLLKLCYYSPIQCLFTRGVSFF